VTNSEIETINARDELNEYLEKPLELDSGVLSTQINLSATSLSTGGLEADLILKKNARILVHDGSTVRVVIGKLS
jgi:hypothetical protein